MSDPVPPLAPAKLKAWRVANGLSQHKAAAQVGVSQPTWGEWENGRANPDLQSFRRLAELGIVVLGDFFVPRTKEAPSETPAPGEG